MEHASVMPGLGRLAERIFECIRCGHVQMVAKLAPR
jgi:transcription elongation factor Elf1